MSPSEAEVCVAFVTAPDVQIGSEIARTLVEERLAACVNLVPGVRSVYRWEGEVQEEAEVLLVVKTLASRSGELSARVKAIHPSDLPEILSLPVTEGSAAYLDWVRREATP